MNIDEAELQIASRRLLEAGRSAQDLFDEHKVRLLVADDRGFEVKLLLNGKPLASFLGDSPMEVSDAVASFVIHLATRPLEE